jgi:hypothetical protein
MVGSQKRTSIPTTNTKHKVKEESDHIEGYATESSDINLGQWGQLFENIVFLTKALALPLGPALVGSSVLGVMKCNIMPA